MRETKFRGKSDLSIEELEEAGVPHKNGWIVGNLIGDEKLPVIVGPIAECSDEYFNTEWWASVIPEIVGQYTGLKDKTGVEVYEGDIVEDDILGISLYVIKFVKGRFTMVDSEDGTGSLWILSEECKVVGNIHDNPELLEVAK